MQFYLSLILTEDSVFFLMHFCFNGIIELSKYLHGSHHPHMGAPPKYLIEITTTISLSAMNWSSANHALLLASSARRSATCIPPCSSLLLPLGVAISFCAFICLAKVNNRETLLLIFSFKNLLWYLEWWGLTVSQGKINYVTLVKTGCDSL